MPFRVGFPFQVSPLVAPKGFRNYISVTAQKLLILAQDEEAY